MYIIQEVTLTSLNHRPCFFPNRDTDGEVTFRYTPDTPSDGLIGTTLTLGNP